MNVTVLYDAVYASSVLPSLFNYATSYSSPVKKGALTEIDFIFSEDLWPELEPLVTAIHYRPLQVEVQGDISMQALEWITARIVQDTGLNSLGVEYQPVLDKGMVKWTRLDSDPWELDVYVIPPFVDDFPPMVIEPFGKDWRFTVSGDPIALWCAQQQEPEMRTYLREGIVMVNNRDDQQTLQWMIESEIASFVFMIDNETLANLGGADVWNLDVIPDAPEVEGKTMVRSLHPLFTEDWFIQMAWREGAPYLYEPWMVNSSSDPSVRQWQLFYSAKAVLSSAAVLPWLDASVNLVTLFIDSSGSYNTWHNYVAGATFPNAYVIHPDKLADIRLASYMFTEKMLYLIPVMTSDGDVYTEWVSTIDPQLVNIQVPPEYVAPRTWPPSIKSLDDAWDDLSGFYQSMGF